MVLETQRAGGAAGLPMVMGTWGCCGEPYSNGVLENWGELWISLGCWEFFGEPHGGGDLGGAWDPWAAVGTWCAVEMLSHGEGSALREPTAVVTSPKGTGSCWWDVLLGCTMGAGLAVRSGRRWGQHGGTGCEWSWLSPSLGAGGGVLSITQPYASCCTAVASQGTCGRVTTMAPCKDPESQQGAGSSGPPTVEEAACAQCFPFNFGFWGLSLHAASRETCLLR